MRKIIIGFQISGENIDSVGMMKELFFPNSYDWKRLESELPEIYVWDKLEICLKYAWDMREVPPSRVYIWPSLHHIWINNQVPLGTIWHHLLPFGVIVYHLLLLRTI